MPLTQATSVAPAANPVAGRRVGLVLGAGGMAGLAFHAGVLAALSEALGWDPRSAELVVGTSAGSITAAALRAGLAAPDLYARACGDPLTPEAAEILAPVDRAMDGRAPVTAGPMVWRPAAPRVLWPGARRLGGVRPGVVAAGLLPAGRMPTTVIEAGVGALFPDRWPQRPTWLCALSLDDGRLTVFGRADAPSASVGAAVAASCAIPGYFAPVEIGGVRYVDGGAYSTVNLAEVRGEQLDVVIVSAPMARAGSRPPLVPPGLPAAVGALGRELNRFQLGFEARAVRGAGTPVVAFSPTVEDRFVMGLNPMDGARRAPIARQARQSALRRLERPEGQRLLGALLGAED